MAESGPGKDRLIVAVVFLATLMITLDVSLVNISLPAVIKEWEINTSMAMWVLLAYGLAISSFLLLFGKLGERVGFKLIFSIGFIIFLCGTTISFLSTNIDMLIGARFFQGIGASMMTALAFASITRYVSPQARGKGLGLVAAAGSLGAVIGPTLGGYITSAFGFHAIFLVNIPIGLVALILAQKAIPGDRTGAKARFDVIGALLIFLGLFSLTYALNMGQQSGWTSAPILATAIGAALLIPAFIVWEMSKAKDPLLDMKMARQRNVILPSLSSMMIMAAFSGAFVIMPFYFELMHHMTSAESGQMFLWATVTMVVGGIVAGILADRLAVRTIAIVSLVIAAVALFIMSTIVKDTGLLTIGLMLLLLGIGAGFFYPAASKLIMLSAPREMQGEVSGLLRTLQQVGSTLGVAVFTTVLTSKVEVSKSVEGFIDGMSLCMIIGGIMVALGVVFLLLTKRAAMPRQGEAQ